MKPLISICFILLLTCSCETPSNQESAKETLRQMLGTWTFEGTALTETWSMIDDQHYQGTVNRSFNGELEPMQHIDIRFYVDSVSYTGTRIGAHESALPINYVLKSAEDDQMIFAHVHGGFPQEIIYELTEANRFSVTMSGTQEGRSRSQRFNYTKAQ